MKIPNWAKIILWGFLIVLLSWLLSKRYDALIQGTLNAGDIILFLIWIGLIAALVFQEVDFFGVRLKKEIDELKSEFKEQIINLRSDIQTINMKAEMNPQIIFPLPKDSDLSDIKENIQPVIKQSTQDQVKSTLKNEVQLVPETTQYLFSVRYAIESELNRIIDFFTTFDSNFEKFRPRTVIQMIDFVKSTNWVDKDYVNALRDVLAICNAAIHGTELSEAKIGFVRDVAPTLIEKLKIIADELRRPSIDNQTI